MKEKLIILGILIAIIIMTLISCDENEPPNVAIKIYAGSSKDAAIIRLNPNEPEERIYAVDSKFNDYMCMTYEDYKKKIDSYTDNCAIWEKAKQNFIDTHDMNKVISCIAK